MPQLIISVVNQKGGVGKTTCTANLGAALASLGRSVCLLDNDPQNNLSSHLLSSAELADPNILCVEDLYLDVAHTLRRKRITVSSQRGLRVIPSTKRLLGVEFWLQAYPNRELKLREQFATIPYLVSECDILLIDNPPNLSTLSLNGLSASTHVLVPVQLEYFSLEGLSQLRQTIDLVREKWNPELKLMGILPNQVHARRRLNDEVRESLDREFPGKLFRSSIRMSVALPESAGHGKTVNLYAPASPAASEFQSLAKEVLSRGN